METSVFLKSQTASCPDCGAEVRLLGRAMIGEVFGCGACGAQLEVASLAPPQLEPLARVDEDYAELD
ncbi:MAG: lysine biosynthesis protein LysW [Planctomycetota bacterium]